MSLRGRRPMSAILGVVFPFYCLLLFDGPGSGAVTHFVVGPGALGAVTDFVVGTGA